jgi:D-alanyl-D-alanine carboxypeptidase (penicillin-binding protein 5/6)
MRTQQNFGLAFGVLALLVLCCTGYAAAQKRAQPAGASASHSSRGSVISKNPYLGAILVDATTGKVLAEDNADARGYPASMLKLMDLLIILERIEQKQLSLQELIPVSARSSKTGGSQVWLAENESFTLDEMLYALMVQSANDAAMALAEKVAGSAEAFVQLMNARARQLGMNNTVFHSVHGLPPSTGQEHDVTTARDFSILCREVLKHPDALRYTSTREHPFRPDAGPKTVMMRTHNHLLGHVNGVDGLKTGYFVQAGYSIAVSASRNNQRVLAIVLGSADRKVRDAKATELISKGFAALASAPGTAESKVPSPISPTSASARK